MTDRAKQDRTGAGQGGENGDVGSESALDRRTLVKTVGAGLAGSVLGTGLPGSAVAGHDEAGTAIRVNQVGYPTDGWKVAVLTDEFADLSSVTSFEVRRVEDGSVTDEVALRGDPNTSSDAGRYDDRVTAEISDVAVSKDANDDGTEEDHPVSGHTVRHLDFSDLTAAGEYAIVAGDHQSHPFRIGDPADVYGDLLVDVGRLYTLHRANANVTDSHSAVDIGPGHREDADAVVRQLADGTPLSEYGIAVSEGAQIDVTGGWYDAGDYGKYAVNTAVTVAQFLLAYERNPGVFEPGQFGIEGVARVYDAEGSEVMPNLAANNDHDLPDLLAEAMYGIRFLSKMQDDSGHVFFKVGPGFPAMDVPPSDHLDGLFDSRFVLGVSSASTAMAGAVFAMAERIFRSEGLTDYADRMATQADDAWSWLQTHRPIGDGTVWHQSVDQDADTGAYGRAPYGMDANFDGAVDSADEEYYNPDLPDLYWFAAEMLRTRSNNTSQYENLITSGVTDVSNIPTGNTSCINDAYYNHPETAAMPITVAGAQPIDWNNPVTLGHYAYWVAEGAQSSWPATASDNTFDGADRWGLGTDVWTVNDRSANAAYPMHLWDWYWGCLKNGVSRGAITRLASDNPRGDFFDQSSMVVGWTDLSGSTLSGAMTDWSLAPLHGVLGRSATGYSYVTGYGEKSPDDPHHRISNSTGVLPPAMLVGGPNNTVDARTAEGDTTADHIDDRPPSDGGTPMALSYVDDVGSYATNEWAINYTAPLLFLLAEAVDSPPQPQLQSPYDGATEVPGRVQAEDFDRGGEGVAYHDVDGDYSTPAGEDYREGDVDLGEYPNRDSEEQFRVGSLSPGEWLEYTVDVRIAGTYAIKARVAPVGSGEFTVSVDGGEVGTASFDLDGGTHAWRLASVGSVDLSAGLHRIRFDVGDADFDLDWFEVSEQGPYGLENEVPGRVPAENFDYGADGVAYHDADDESSSYFGDPHRDTRVDLGDHRHTRWGIEEHVREIAAGEWLEYTVYAAQAGQYVFNAQVAAAGEGGFTVSVDGTAVGSVSFSGTGGYDWRLVSPGMVQLSEGRHVVRIDVDEGGWQFDWFEFAEQGPFGMEPVLPGRIQAENFDYGGERVASHEVTGGVSGAYRDTSVEVLPHVELESSLPPILTVGFHVDETADGEWLEYTASVAEAGTYEFTARVGSSSGGEVTVLVDGEAAGTASFGSTGGDLSYDVVTAGETELSRGRHTLRVEMGAGDFTLDWIEADRLLVPASPTNFRTQRTAPGGGTLLLWEATGREAPIDHFRITFEGEEIDVSANGSGGEWYANVGRRTGEITVVAVDEDGRESPPASTRVEPYGD